MEVLYFAYILRNPAGKFYVGHTSDLAARLRDHNRIGETEGKFTRKNGPWTLVWSEPHPTRVSAMRREREIKSWKSSRSIRGRLLGNMPL